MKKVFLFFLTFFMVLYFKIDSGVDISFSVNKKYVLPSENGSIYYDTGGGYSEGNKINFSYLENTIKVHIPTKATLASIRLDPVNNRSEKISKIVISDLKINDHTVEQITPLHDIGEVQKLSTGSFAITFSGQDPYLKIGTNISLRNNITSMILNFFSFIIFTVLIFILIKGTYRNRLVIRNNLKLIINDTKCINIIYWFVLFFMVFYINISISNRILYITLYEKILMYISLLSHTIFYFSFLFVIFYFIKRKFKGVMAISIFYGILSLFVVLYYIDSLLYALQSMHIADLAKMAYYNGVNSLLGLIKAAKIEDGLITRYIMYATGVFLLGISIFILGEKVKRYCISIKKILIILTMSFFIVVLEQVISYYTKNQQIWQEEQKSYPMYIQILHAKDFLFQYKVKLKPLVSSYDSYKIKSLELQKHNIYFLVVETLRNDMIDSNTMPNFTDFRRESTYIKSIANANATHHAWYALMNSSYPVYWNDYRDRHIKRGSLPLNILKSNGYKVNVFSSADLDYFDYTHTIFGTTSIVDNFANITESGTPERDIEAINLATSFNDQHASEHNNVNLIWLDSTHHNYFLPNNFKPKFLPIPSAFDYTKTTYTEKEVSQIKNKYRNSLYFVDTLIGKFINNLKKNHLYDDSIIIIVGDHGEEFMEHGHLAHSSTLYSQQINNALGIKLPNINHVSNHMVSSVDIWPTILKYLGYSDNLNNWISGRDANTNHNIVLDGVKGLSIPELYAIVYANKKIIFTIKDGNLNIKEILDLHDKKISNISSSFFKSELINKIKSIPFIESINDEQTK